MLDRRRFLAAAGAGTASIKLSALTAIAISGDRYINTRLGLSLDKPSTWEFVAARDFLQRERGQAAMLADPDLTQRLRDESGTPLLTMVRVRPAVRHDEIVPTMHVYADPLDEPPLTVEKLRTHGHAALDRVMRGAEIEEAATATVVDRRPGARLIASYDMRFADGRQRRVRFEMVIVANGHTEFTFSLATAPRDFTRLRQVLMRMLASVRIS